MADDLSAGHPPPSPLHLLTGPTETLLSWDKEGRSPVSSLEQPGVHPTSHSSWRCCTKSPSRPGPPVNSPCTQLAWTHDIGQWNPDPSASWTPQGRRHSQAPVCLTFHTRPGETWTLPPARSNTHHLLHCSDFRHPLPWRAHACAHTHPPPGPGCPICSWGEASALARQEHPFGANQEAPARPGTSSPWPSEAAAPPCPSLRGWGSARGNDLGWVQLNPTRLWEGVRYKCL